MNRTGIFRAIKHASVSRGIGPGSTSPPTTTRSMAASRTSRSTASSAKRLPWMSYSATTVNELSRIGRPQQKDYLDRTVGFYERCRELGGVYTAALPETHPVAVRIRASVGRVLSDGFPKNG